MAFLWDFKRMSMGFPLDSYGVSLACFMICLWYFFGISTICLLEFYDILCYYYWISMEFLWHSYGITMMCLFL